MEKLISKDKLHNCIANVKNAGDTLRPIEDYSEASILVIFINNEIDQESYILITQRKKNLRKHAGPLDFTSKVLFNEWKLGETEEEITISAKDNY